MYWVNLGSALPPEFGKTRPGLVVSNSVQNAILDSVVVLPLSTVQGEIWPLRVRIDGFPGKESFAVLPGIRQVSCKRLGKLIGHCSVPVMERIDEALSLYLRD
jgi:mRNA-degrading endonuclease toxin of MazEF toxin-antitoxin module